MRELDEPHLAHGVVVLVERETIDADGDRATAAARVGDRREARAEMQVGREVGDDARAGRGDDVELVGPGVNAVGKRQPLRQEADVVQISDDAAGKSLVGPVALVDRLEQMHVHAAAGDGRSLGDRLEQRL